MVLTKENNGPYYILMAMVITSLICFFSQGISGNDFWWHVKTGEWMVNNMSLPETDIFSWYARENNIEWSSHEWLYQVLIYLLHHYTGDLGVVIFSLSSAILMTLLIMHRNRDAIKNNILLSTLFFFPMSMQMKIMFFGRPHVISFFLIFLTLHCLYKLREDENSSLIFLMPFLACFWVNLHGGSSSLSYILCFIALFSGLFDFSFGKLESRRFSQKQLFKYSCAACLSIVAMLINPYGVDMLVYPYANMGDKFMQEMIVEWSAPDAKVLAQLIFYYLTFFLVGTTLIVTDRKIRLLDLLVFGFFSYMFLRSLRFVFLFYMSATFYIFYYFMPAQANHKNEWKSPEKSVFLGFMVIMVVISMGGIAAIKKTAAEGNLIKKALGDEFVELIKQEKPARLFNDYGFGETLIYNGIETFVDARADLFSPYNLRDSRSLTYLRNIGSSDKTDIFDPEAVIASYSLDAFIIQPNTPLASYLRGKPDNYAVLLQDAHAVYFKKMSHDQH